jgi:hypothetical protein
MTYESYLDMYRNQLFECYDDMLSSFNINERKNITKIKQLYETIKYILICSFKDLNDPIMNEKFVNKIIDIIIQGFKSRYNLEHICNIYEILRDICDSDISKLNDYYLHIGKTMFSQISFQNIFFDTSNLSNHLDLSMSFINIFEKMTNIGISNVFLGKLLNFVLSSYMNKIQIMNNIQLNSEINQKSMDAKLMILQRFLFERAGEIGLSTLYINHSLPMNDEIYKKHIRHYSLEIPTSDDLISNPSFILEIYYLYYQYENHIDNFKFMNPLFVDKIKQKGLQIISQLS